MGKSPCICVPLLGKNTEELAEELLLAQQCLPDMLEWRADYFANLNELLPALQQIKTAMPQTPLLFTLRTKEEGGANNLSCHERLPIICTAISSGYIQYVDIELHSPASFRDIVSQLAVKHDVLLVLSNHHFHSCPTQKQMEDIFFAEQKAGANVAKLAVMPQNPSDVLSLLAATYAFSNQQKNISVVAIAMGELGMMTRISGHLFGSAFTFASLKSASAPGQMSIQNLQQMLYCLTK